MNINVDQGQDTNEKSDDRAEDADGRSRSRSEREALQTTSCSALLSVGRQGRRCLMPQDFTLCYAVVGSSDGSISIISFLLRGCPVQPQEGYLAYGAIGQL